MATMNRKTLLLLAAAWTAVGTSAHAQAPAATVKPLVLRGVMQEMDRQVLRIADAIGVKDWQAIEQATRLIADHPEPPLAEKLRIFAFMGIDLPRFKGYDTQTHEAALAVSDAAKDKDAAAVGAKLRILQARCDACHDAFRKPFVAHFYGTR